MALTDAELEQALRLVEKARALPPDDPRYVRLEQAVAHLVKSAKKKRRRQRARQASAHDKAVLSTTEMATARFGAPAEPPPTAVLRRHRRCYVCKAPYQAVHPRYHQLCRACGDQSLAARTAAVDLSGRRALVTGGRIKIGHAVALALLRMGCEVLVTTRFPSDAARRFAAQPDQADWWHRLHLYGLDFRLLPSVMKQVARWRETLSLDILINNAAQTVWRPPAYYGALQEGEQQPLPIPAAIHSRVSPLQQNKGIILSDALFPPGADIQGNPLDLRRTNSWVQSLEQVAPMEMIEAQIINAIVPFVLCSQLAPCLRRAAAPDRYIVNVTALEGMFRREHKSPRHPHTNMAKAGLNMLTRTSAEEYAQSGIYMVSVDPGWMSHEGPAQQVAAAYATGFHPPLDAADSAARVLDPILRGVQGAPVHGVLLKDFTVVPW